MNKITLSLKANEIYYDTAGGAYKPVYISYPEHGDYYVARPGVVDQWETRPAHWLSVIVEPIRWRAKKGEQYWYIDSTLEITEEMETGGLLADKRYKEGNYAATPKELSEKVSKIREILQEKN